MRKSRAEAAETRRRIVETAASAFREGGIQATGLADIMSAAGLSHGGFYRHFASKDQLVAEACDESMRSVVEVARDVAAGNHGPQAMRAFIERYLSDDHLHDWSTGCPLASMGSELARADETTRRVATSGFLDLVEIFEAQYRERGESDPRGRALFTVSALVGAVTLSRISDDAGLAEEILTATEQRLQPQTGA
jgi:TetR/AcrR family transcriptional repressor of nem operon